MPIPFDLARCTGTGCPNKGTCQRAAPIPEEQRLVSWLAFSPMEDHPNAVRCALYLPLN